MKGSIADIRADARVQDAYLGGSVIPQAGAE
jgi:hypothetical protein